MALPFIHIYRSTHPLSHTRCFQIVLQTRYARTSVCPSSSTPLCPTDSPPPAPTVTPRVSEHEQLLLLSSISNHFRRLGKYSFTIVEQLTPRPMFPLPHLSEFEDDDGETGIFDVLSVLLLSLVRYVSREYAFIPHSDSVPFLNTSPPSFLRFLQFIQMKRRCANSILLFSQAVRFTFQIYAHLLLLQHRYCPRLLHLRPLYQPYDRGCLRSQYSSSSSTVPTSTRCLVRFYLDTGDAMQQYPNFEGHV
jgi:hypothetical protein